MSELDKIKICHVTSMHEWNDDRIFQRACQGLADIGFDVSLIAEKETDDKINDVKITALKKRTGIKRRIFSSYEAFRKVQQLHPDIIHFHDPDLLPWMLVLALSGHKVVYDIHENYLSRLANKSFFVPQILTFLYRSFEHFCINQFAGVVTVTQSMERLYANTSPLKLVIRNVPYIKLLTHIHEQDKKDERVTIITSGSNSPTRNCVQTVEALPYIVKEYPDMLMKFVGGYVGNMKAVLQAKAKELAVEQNILLEDKLPWLENFKRISRSHIGCVFYQDNLNNRVGVPNRLFEYMITRLAIVGEKFPEVAHVLNDANCGVVVNSADPKSIADGILSLLRDKEKMKKMGENGFKSVSTKYNYENSLTEQKLFYQTIVKSEDK